jgi:hypothetical protein
MTAQPKYYMNNFSPLGQLSLAAAVCLLLLGCKKTPPVPSPSGPKPSSGAKEAFVVGFDPCAVGRGYVLILPGVPDTVVTYTLPAGLHTYPPAFFQGASQQFLFPVTAQTRYKLRVDYFVTPPAQKVNSLCQGNINLADFNRFTKGRQITITAAEAVQ